jgi:hypothetical protein
MTDRSSIIDYIRREHPELEHLAREIEGHADKRRREPTILAGEWIHIPSAGYFR